MANAIKYSTTGDTLSLKKGNIFFGVGDVGKGPSSATTYYNGVTPSASGYTIYSYNASQTSKLSFHTAVDDAALRDYTNRVSGESFASAAQCLNWYATQTNYVCVNRDYESIITNGLVLNLDAGFTPSYSTSGASWYDLSYSGNNGTLTNGPTFNTSNGGSIVFDGVDDYCSLPNTNTLSAGTGDFTFNAWIYPTSWPNNSWSPIYVTSTTNGIWIGQNSSNQFVLRAFGVADRLQFSPVPSANTWTNVTITRIGTTATLYYNGVSMTSSTTNQNFIQGFTYIGNDVGSGSGPAYYQGRISNIQFYKNIGLTSTQVLSNYNALKSRFVASFDPDAQAFITAAGITNSTQQNAINDLVIGLKADSLWTQITAIYPFVGGTASSHKYNLKDPRDLDVAYRLTFYGGWVHDNQGILGNGTNTYADTYYVNNTISTIGAYTYGANSSFSYTEDYEYCDDEGNCYTNYGARLSFGQISANDWTSTVSGNYTQGHVQTGLGSGGVNQTGYRNGRSVGTNTVSGGPIYPKGKLAIGAVRYIYTDVFGGVVSDYISSYGNTLQSFAYFSSNALNSTQTQNLYNRIQSFQNSLGRLITTLDPSDSDVFAFTSNLNMISANDSSVVNALNTFVSSLKTQNLWSKITYLNPIITNLRNILPYSSSYPSNISYPVGGWTRTQSAVSYSTILTPSYNYTNTSVAIFSGNGVSGDHLLTSYTVPTTNGSAYTLSTYVKANTNNFIQLVVSGTSNLWANFNVNTGTVGTVGSAATASIQDTGNGWYRCIISGTITNTSTNALLRLVTSTTSTLSENNTLNTSVYLWISQFELGSTATYPQVMTTYNLSVENQFYNAIKYPTGTGNLFILNNWTSTPKGMLANGTDDYAYMSSPLSNYMTTSNGHIAIYSRNNITLTNKYLFGVVATNFAYLRVDTGSPLSMSAQMGSNNSGNNIQAFPSNTLGLFMPSYSGSTFKLYQNGNSIASTSSYPTPLSLPQQGQTFGAYNNNNVRQNFSAVDISLISLGQGFTDAEASSYNTINNTYQTALSRNV